VKRNLVNILVGLTLLLLPSNLMAQYTPYGQATPQGQQGTEKPAQRSVTPPSGRVKNDPYLTKEYETSDKRSLGFDAEGKKGKKTNSIDPLTGASTKKKGSQGTSTEIYGAAKSGKNKPSKADLGFDGPSKNNKGSYKKKDGGAFGAATKGYKVDKKSLGFDGPSRGNKGSYGKKDGGGFGAAKKGYGGIKSSNAFGAATKGYNNKGKSSAFGAAKGSSYRGEKGSSNYNKSMGKGPSNKRQAPPKKKKCTKRGGCSTVWD